MRDVTSLVRFVIHLKFLLAWFLLSRELCWGKSLFDFFLIRCKNPWLLPCHISMLYFTRPIWVLLVRLSLFDNLLLELAETPLWRPVPRKGFVMTIPQQVDRSTLCTLVNLIHLRCLILNAVFILRTLKTIRLQCTEAHDLDGEAADNPCHLDWSKPIWSRFKTSTHFIPIIKLKH